MARKISVFLFVALTAILLTGCVKGEFSLDVNADGSGSYTIKMGMTPQALALGDEVQDGPAQGCIPRRVGPVALVPVAEETEDALPGLPVISALDRV